MPKVFDQSTDIAILAVAFAATAHAALAQAPLPGGDKSNGPPGAEAVFVEVPEVPESLIDDAANRVEMGEYLEAVNVVELEIEKIERRSNRYNIELARPLVVLGDALAGVGDREGALGAYDRAVHITRINRGLHHPSQVDIVYREAATLAADGAVARANRRHEYAYGILLRSYGGDNPMLLPGIFALADWYLVNYNIFSARSFYEHALSVADAAFDADDPHRLRALRGVAATYRNERFPPYQPAAKSDFASHVTYRYGVMPAINNFAKGERALIDVVNAVKASAHASVEDLAAAVLELGDWYLVFEKHTRATTLYRHVWELLESNPDLLAQTFDSPTPLYLPLPGDPDVNGANSGTPRSGVVELSFRVDGSGGVSGIATVHSEPQDLMDVEVRRAVRRARYRPAFDGRTTLATEDVRVSHTFVYYPTDDLPPDDASAERTDAANPPAGTAQEAGGSAQAHDTGRLALATAAPTEAGRRSLR